MLSKWSLVRDGTGTYLKRKWGKQVYETSFKILEFTMSRPTLNNLIVTKTSYGCDQNGSQLENETKVLQQGHTDTQWKVSIIYKIKKAAFRLSSHSGQLSPRSSKAFGLVMASSRSTGQSWTALGMPLALTLFSSTYFTSLLNSEVG